MLEEKSFVKSGRPMSRLAKKPIIIPEKTEVSLNGNMVQVKGPLGELKRSFPEFVAVTIEEKQITVSLTKINKDTKPFAGTVVAHIKNMVAGVNKMFEKKLIVEGVGFKADVKGAELVMALGFSHPVNIKIPPELKVTTEKGQITITGISKDAVGAFAAKVRSYKEPEPYKGKGIRYSDEIIRRKQGKKTA